MDFLKSKLIGISVLTIILAFIIGTAGYPPNYKISFIILFACYLIGLYMKSPLVNILAFIAAVMVSIFNNF